MTSRAGRLVPWIVLLLVSVAACVAAVPAAAVTHRLEVPRVADIARAQAFRDSTLGADGARRLEASADWGGTFTASTGETVTIRLSDTYPRDTAVPQRWANFLASLLHGSELSQVTLYLAPPAEVKGECGRGALACYGRGVIVAPGEDPTGVISAEAVVAHEYGHHVAYSRRNDPWRAIDRGTKRWASYVNVCARSQAGELFPGDEGGEHYRLNPGEAFAEAYRVLNERRLGIAETPWQIVSQSLYPDDTALSLLGQDVTSPWVANTRRSFAATLSRKRPVRTYSIATPNDGTAQISVRAAKPRVALDLVDAAGKRVGRTVAPAGSSRSVSLTVCGSRTLRARVSLVRGSGQFRLGVSNP